VDAAFLLYITILVATAFQEEFAPLAGGLAAHHGHGEVWLVGLAVAAGSWLHGIVLFQVGRRGRGIIGRPALRKPLDLVRGHPLRSMLGIRFAYGLRLGLPIACGAAGLPSGPFAAWTAVSSVVWAAIFTAFGWGAGETAVRVERDLRHAELPLGAALLVMGAVFYLWRRARAREAGLE